MNKIQQSLIAAVLLAAPSHAFATGFLTCDSGDKSGWQSTETLQTKMEAEGWQVRRIKEDGGCYEAYGTTPEGQRVEAYFHPVTLEKLLVHRRGEVLFKKAD